MRMRNQRTVAAVAAALCGLGLASAGARAAQTTFNVVMSGANEVDNNGNPGVGDPDATASGTVTLDDVADTVSWNFTYQNVSGAAISGFHIHGPDATPDSNRPVFVPLEPLSSTAVPNGTQTGTRTTAQTADLGTRIDQILANPTGFYVNIHSSGAGGFPAGAARGMLPEPSALGLLGFTAAGLLGRRRGRKA